VVAQMAMDCDGAGAAAACARCGHRMTAFQSGERGKERSMHTKEKRRGQITNILQSAGSSGGTQANPCHQRLNNSSCISVSQGILNTSVVIGRTRASRCSPLFVEGCWKSSRCRKSWRGRASSGAKARDPVAHDEFMWLKWRFVAGKQAVGK